MILAPNGLAEAMRELRKRVYSPQEIRAHALSFDWNVSARRLIEIAARSGPGA